MVIWSNLEVSCPVCSHRLVLRELGGGFADGQDSDLLVRMSGKHVIQADVHSCHRCRFSGYVPDFLATLSNAVQKRFLEEITPSLILSTSARSITRKPRTTKKRKSPPTPLPHIQYDWAARTAEWLGYPATEVGLRLLRGYWCLRLRPSTSLPQKARDSLAKGFLKRSIPKLRQGLRHETNRNLLYLIGELCRRNGNFLLAASYFRRYQDQDEGPAYLKQASLKLRQRAQDQDATPLTMEEVLYNRKPQGHNPH